MYTTLSPLGCLYGDGYVKIYAGKLAVDGEDEPGLLAFESADFESEMTMVSPCGLDR